MKLQCFHFFIFEIPSRFFTCLSLESLFHFVKLVPISFVKVNSLFIFLFMIITLSVLCFTLKTYFFKSTVSAVPCLRPRSGWAADLARGREWTQTLWRTFKCILNCLIMCHSQTRSKCTILSQTIKKNLTCVAHQKFWVSAPVPQERSRRGVAKSLNTSLSTGEMSL